MPIVPGGFVHNDQAPLVAIYRPDVNEQYSSETQAMTGPASHAQPNIPVWQHFAGQPYHYPTPGLLNANAKAFNPPPGIGWVPNQVGTSQGSQGLSNFVMNSRRQSARKDQQRNVAGGGFRPFVGRNVRGTTNFNVSKDNQQVDPQKSTPEPADWI